MTMTRVSRADFIAAIEAGIKSANLSDADADALRKVGTDAKVIGTNYNTVLGCPVIRAKLVEREYGEQTGSGVSSVDRFHQRSRRLQSR
jgi:hypothetical protein